MIRKIRTFYGKQNGQHGDKKTTVNIGVAWLCEKCGEVIFFEHLVPKHFCKSQIKPVVHSDTGSSLPP